MVYRGKTYVAVYASESENCKRCAFNFKLDCITMLNCETGMIWIELVKVWKKNDI